MAMTDPPSTPRGAGDVMLADAGVALRDHVDDRWVEIADRVLARALTATRRSLPVRAHSDNGGLHFSEQVLVAMVRDAVSGVVEAAVDQVQIETNDRDVYTGVTIQVVAEFGAPLLEVADEIRDLAAQRLEELLGPVSPPVTVTTMHVHVDDVTKGDD